MEPLVCRVRVMWLRPVWASRLGEALAKTEDLSKPEWCFLPVVGSLMIALLLAVSLTIRIRVQQTGINGVFLLSCLDNGENLSIFRVALSFVLPEGASGRRERNCPVSEKQRHDFLVFSLHGFRQRRATPAIMIPPVIHFLGMLIDTSNDSLTGRLAAIHLLDETNQYAVIFKVNHIPEARVVRIAGVNYLLRFCRKKREQTTSRCDKRSQIHSIWKKVICYGALYQFPPLSSSVKVFMFHICWSVWHHWTLIVRLAIDGGISVGARDVSSDETRHDFRA